MDMICQMALKDWRSLNSFVSVLSEEQAKKMLDYEVLHGRRTTVIVRLHQRYTALRAAREREDLIKLCN